MVGCAGRLSRWRGPSLGYLAELFRFPGWYTAEEVLELHQRLAGSHGGAAERTRLLELVALTDARDRRVDGMSKGMQQRLGIAQALVGEPRVLLLDEPTSALDPVGRRTVRLLLEDLRSRGVSVLINSHLLSEIELVCDRVAILFDGELVAAGTPAELSRPRGVELDTDEGVRMVEGATREDAPRLVAEAVAAAAGSTASASSRRRSRTSTSRRSAERPIELGRRHRPVRAAGGAAAEGLRGRPAADRGLSRPLLAGHALRPRTARRDHAAERRATSTRGRSPAPSCSGWRCSRRSSSASCSRSS